MSVFVAYYIEILVVTRKLSASQFEMRLQVICTVKLYSRISDKIIS